MRPFTTLVVIGLVLLLVYFVLKRAVDSIRSRKSSKRHLHDELADVAEDIAAASRIAVALASAAAFLAAPAGLLAVATAFGIVPRPLAVTVLPVLVTFAIGAAALSAAAKLYAKSRRKKK
jgi:hypothetical protein